MGTATVPSAMEWRQPSQLPTTSSGDICMPSCKLHKHQRVSRVRFVTPDKESSMNTLWQEEEFEQICRRESLTEKAVKIEKTSTKGNATISTRQCMQFYYQQIHGPSGADAMTSMENIGEQVFV